MSKVFNLENNIVLNSLRDRSLPYNVAIIDDYDSYHCIVNIRISSYYQENTHRLMEFLYKNKFSINALIRTTDNKYISINRSETHSFNHIRCNSVLLSSYTDMLRKIRILEKSLYDEEVDDINNKIKNNKDIIRRFQTNIVRLSLIDIMSLLDITLNSHHISSYSNSSNSSSNVYSPLYYNRRNIISNRSTNRDNDSSFRYELYEEVNDPPIEIYRHPNSVRARNTFPSLPGGHVDRKKDKTPIDTLKREISEEMNLHDNLIITSIRYHNIFDKINEKFYHNIIYICSVDQSSEKIQRDFEATYEVKSLIFHSSNDKIISCITQLDD